MPNTEGVDTGVATTEGDQQAATETDGLATDTGTPVTVEEEFKACKSMAAFIFCHNASQAVMSGEGGGE